MWYFLLWVVVVLCGVVHVEAAAPVFGYVVINTYPHSSTAFTEGLVYDNAQTDILYESTGLEHDSAVRKANLLTGDVLQWHNITDDSIFAEGLTIVSLSTPTTISPSANSATSSLLYQLTWTNGVVYVYDKQTMKLVNTLKNPASSGWGLTTDREHLIMSDGTDRIWFLNPSDFSVAKTLLVRDDGKPIIWLNELEYINGTIWANVWETDRIVNIDPQSGNVTATLNMKGLKTPGGDVMNGIAYDAVNSRIFVTGKWWTKLYQVRPCVPGTPGCVFQQ